MKNEETWPNFFIVGAAKAGTTTLYAYLKSTKGVYMSPVKEPRYFNRFKKKQNTRKKRITNEAEYLKLFSKVKDEKAIGEATPGYLRDPKVAELIHEKVPNAKILIILRDPIQRAFSDYLMKKTKGTETRTFHQLVEEDRKIDEHDREDLGPILYGLYANKVKKYVDVFGSQNVKILIFEEFIKDTVNQVKEVLNFLGVDSEIPSNIGKVYNAYGEPKGKISAKILSSVWVQKIVTKIIPQKIAWYLKEKLFLDDKEKPKMSKEDNILLQKFYQEDVKELEMMLKRKLPWSWFNESQL